MTTDPYGDLEYVIGSGDNFWCFDYCLDPSRRRVRLHAVINSETGFFIQDAEPPIVVSYARATDEARRLVYAALDWCAANAVRHSVRSWNQDPLYFARVVAQAIAQAQGASYRRVPRKNGKGGA